MFNFLRKKIGIIGFGNMGSAIAEKVKSKYEVFVFEKDAAKTKGLTGIKIASGIPELLKQSQVIILAIKPQDFETILAEIKDGAQDKLVVSIAAGITTGYMEKFLGQARVVRAMPNLGAKIGRSVTCLAKGKFAANQDMELARNIFSSIGVVEEFKEEMMNAATAISGSGPGFWGYLFAKKPVDEWDEYKSNYFIPELASAAKEAGFDEKTASSLAYSVTTASISITEALHIEPGELTKMVASKGGTTEAGLEVLQKGGSLKEAIQAAIRRAKELSRG